MLKKLIPKELQARPLFGHLVGIFAFQPNSSTRTFEYPWAYHVADLRRSMQVMDLGGALSGFPFVLDKMGMSVTVVDPFVRCGPGVEYPEDPEVLMGRLNGIFGTHVALRRAKLENAGLPAASFDRVFCISVLEHLSQQEAEQTIEGIRRVLKPNGLLVLTIDLFLNIAPFGPERANIYGQNLNVKNLVTRSGMEMIWGEKKELLGYPEFDAAQIRADQNKFLKGRSYPVLVQTCVLKNIAAPVDALGETHRPGVPARPGVMRRAL